MRVLMFGWEFPPHMSGGLGTACYGITRALAEKGVDIDFVLPRMHGQEKLRMPQGFSMHQASGTRISWSHEQEEPHYQAQLIHSTSSETCRIQRTHMSTVEQADSRSTQEHESPHATLITHGTLGSQEIQGKQVVENVWQKHVRVHPVKSLLHAYATPQSYEDRQRAYEQERFSYLYDPCGTSGSCHKETQDISNTFMQQASTMLKAETREELLHVVKQSVREEQICTGSHKHIEHGNTVLSLHGGYGQDLMEEVFRYSQSVLGLQIEDVDLIHAHDWMTFPAGIVAKHLTGKPLIVHIHALESDRSGSNVNKEVAAIERAGVEAADTIIAVSHYTKARITELYGIDPAKIAVVHNAVTKEESRAVLQMPKHHEENEKYVLFMGRITFQKGPEYFVEAARLVLSRMPNVRFIMAGSGDMLPRIVRMVAQMRMGSRFHFTGFLRGEDVDRMYALSDLYVMPSVSEPFGIAPLEAMSYDTPVLISRQSGVAEVVQNALKVDFWDVQAMADKICAVLKHPRLAGEMVKQCREELQHIRWENAAHKLIHVYENSTHTS